MEEDKFELVFDKGFEGMININSEEDEFIECIKNEIGAVISGKIYHRNDIPNNAKIAFGKFIINGYNVAGIRIIEFETNSGKVIRPRVMSVSYPKPKLLE